MSVQPSKKLLAWNSDSGLSIFFFQLCRLDSHTHHELRAEFRLGSKSPSLFNLMLKPIPPSTRSKSPYLRIKRFTYQNNYLEAYTSFHNWGEVKFVGISRKQLPQLHRCTITIDIVRTQHVHSFSSARFSERHQLFPGELSGILSNR